MHTKEFAAIIARAETDPGFRGLLVWFPEKIVAEYKLTGKEAKVVLSGIVEDIDLDADMLRRTSHVFDLHDLHSGE